MSTFQSDPTVAGAASILRRLHESYREQVTGLGDDAANWKPGANTNSIYQMLHHALDVERMWLSTAAGNTVLGRPEPWNLTGPASDLVERLDQAERDIQKYLEGPEAPDPAVVRQFRDTQQSNAVSLIRAVRHVAEHLGHIGLTRQTWEQHRDAIDQSRPIASNA